MKRGSGNPTISLDQTEVLAPGRTPDVLELDEALGRLAQVDPRGVERSWFIHPAT